MAVLVGASNRPPRALLGPVDANGAAVTGRSAVMLLPQAPEDWQAPVGLLLNFSGALPAAFVGTCTAEVTADPALFQDLLPANANNSAYVAQARWNAHDTISALTADKNSTIIAPVLGVRLYVSAVTSGGPPQLQVNQPQPSK